MAYFIRLLFHHNVYKKCNNYDNIKDDTKFLQFVLTVPKCAHYILFSVMTKQAKTRVVYISLRFKVFPPANRTSQHILAHRTHTLNSLLPSKYLMQQHTRAIFDKCDRNRLFLLIALLFIPVHTMSSRMHLIIYQISQRNWRDGAAILTNYLIRRCANMFISAIRTELLIAVFSLKDT